MRRGGDNIPRYVIQIRVKNHHSMPFVIHAFKKKAVTNDVDKKGKMSNDVPTVLTSLVINHVMFTYTDICSVHMFVFTFVKLSDTE